MPLKVNGKMRTLANPLQATIFYYQHLWRLSNTARLTRFVRFSWTFFDCTYLHINRLTVVVGVTETGNKYYYVKEKKPLSAH